MTARLRYIAAPFGLAMTLEANLYGNLESPSLPVFYLVQASFDSAQPPIAAPRLSRGNVDEGLEIYGRRPLLSAMPTFCLK
ncbi:hypothetical protein KAH81_06465 [bacterium]|nr:hypothetical protein [bacterium]